MGSQALCCDATTAIAFHHEILLCGSGLNQEFPRVSSLRLMFNRSNNSAPCHVLVGVGSTRSCPVFLACDPNITTIIAMYHAMMLELAAGLKQVLSRIYSSGSQPSLDLVSLALPLSGYYSRRPDPSSGPIPHYGDSPPLGSRLVLTLYWELK